MSSVQDLLTITIAGVQFSLQSHQSITLQHLPPEYQPFMQKISSDNGSIVIPVYLEINHMPDTARMIKIFDTEETWSMYRKDSDYYLSYNPSEYGDPSWLAAFNMNFGKITIYCGDTLIQKDREPVTVFSPLHYPLDQLLLMYILSQRDGLLVHASAFSYHGKGYIFPGRSGAGKSTIAQQFINRRKIEMLSDDRIIIRKTSSSFMVFGTPWAGDAGIAENKSVPLSGIFFIRHGNENRIEQLEPVRAFERLMPVTSIPWYDKEVMLNVLSFCEDLVSAVPAYELSFEPDNTVVDFFEEFISQEEK